MTHTLLPCNTARKLSRGLQLGGLVMLVSIGAAWAADMNTVNRPGKPAGAAAPDAAKTANRPGWNKLSSAEQQALKPLAWSWESMSSGQQRKWLEISKNYPSLSLADQTKMHARMSEWASLTTQERAQARLNFGKTTELAMELSAAEKRAKWEAYQALSAQEKQKLTGKAERKHLGAAPATQPVSPQKLAGVPTPAKISPKPAKADGLPPLPVAGPPTGIAAQSPAEPAATP